MPPEDILVADLELDVERLAERLLDETISAPRTHSCTRHPPALGAGVAGIPQGPRCEPLREAPHERVTEQTKGERSALGVAPLSAEGRIRPRRPRPKARESTCPEERQ